MKGSRVGCLFCAWRRMPKGTLFPEAAGTGECAVPSPAECGGEQRSSVTQPSS